MKNLITCIAILMSIAMNAQSIEWNIHSPNLASCTPHEGMCNFLIDTECGSCDACPMPAVSQPGLTLPPSLLYIEPSLVVCPQTTPSVCDSYLDIQGCSIHNNIDDIYYASLSSGAILFTGPSYIDDVSVHAARSSNGPDSVSIVLIYDGITLIRNFALTNEYVTYHFTDVGCIQAGHVLTAYVKPFGSSGSFLFRSLRVDFSTTCTTGMGELAANEPTIQRSDDVALVTLVRTSNVSVLDGLGRVLFSRVGASGTVEVPLTNGLNIVRAGNKTWKLVK